MVPLCLCVFVAIFLATKTPSHEVSQSLFVVPLCLCVFVAIFLVTKARRHEVSRSLFVCLCGINLSVFSSVKKSCIWRYYINVTWSGK
ncbi:Uncharacterized protein dnm_079640 [Desulfonema magnum]|uniref:Uncharacterized protein n=1 Tax=Desulfonema magnum TaxID=45655 RepID=A0A975GSB7_9BACT|nr:Uncharacterized protein dnm_079640 [Desulfonema magnum]